MVRSSLPMNRLAQGGAILVPMEVQKFEGAVIENEIKYDVHYMVWWTVCGKQMLVFFHEMNHGFYALLISCVCLLIRAKICTKDVSFTLISVIF